jgi:hypothetical protein
MPALLCPPPCPDASESASTNEARIAARTLRTWSLRRRAAGLICLALALGLAALTYTPEVFIAFDLAQVGRQAALATMDDLVQRVFPAPPDTASSRGAAAPGNPNACAPGNRDALGRNLVIERDAWVCGDVTVYVANVNVLGRVDGDVRAVGGSVVIAGQVGGSVTALGGDVNVQPGARVGGDVQSIGGTVVNQADAGAIHGNVLSGQEAVQRNGPQHLFDPYAAEIPWFQLLFWGVAGAAFSLLFPHYVLRVRTIAQRQLAASFVTGVLSLIAGAILVVALTLTCLGIPLALAVLGSLWIAWVIGTVALGSWLGNGLLHLFARESPSTVLGTTLGAMLLGALEALPYVGWPLFAVAGLLGMGASVRAYLAARQARRALRPAA